MVLIIFGTGVNCQVTLSGSTAVSPSPQGVRYCCCGCHYPCLMLWEQEYLSISFGWAIGAALGVWVSGGISVSIESSKYTSTYPNSP
jgi:aquaglyceroporin related protein